MCSLCIFLSGLVTICTSIVYTHTYVSVLSIYAYNTLTIEVLKC